ncbi:hypothetical protein FRB94_003060 [Tulasnella sp. JGI-2019a]|nr:hypothetical protein FRB94_003060 [Tulasnella sp. JGI-2019a]KAG9005311.1 hypothetical protein FRB93_009865 [Tulasnella sp. JGI-2019a]KAG9027612.1 hypothetical protein FRB95_007574 [Tulasnella sp. JGI-2019a]
MVSTRSQLKISSEALPNKRARLEKSGDALTQPSHSPFPKLPVDVVFEIFKRTHPVTLLQLARTNKAMRKELMSKTASEIWRSAQLYHPFFPPCPADMTEPQWAALFGYDCMICWKEKAALTNYELRLRGCVACIRKTCLSFGELFKRCWPGLREQLHEIVGRELVIGTEPQRNKPCPKLSQGRKGGRSRFMPPKFITDRRQRWSSILAGGALHYAPTIEQIGSEVLDFKERIAAGVPDAEAEYEEYVHKRRSIVHATISHADLCRDIDAQKSELVGRREQMEKPLVALPV